MDTMAPGVPLKVTVLFPTVVGYKPFWPNVGEAFGPRFEPRIDTSVPGEMVGVSEAAFTIDWITGAAGASRLTLTKVKAVLTGD